MNPQILQILLDGVQVDRGIARARAKALRSKNCTLSVVFKSDYLLREVQQRAKHREEVFRTPPLVILSEDEQVLWYELHIENDGLIEFTKAQIKHCIEQIVN